MRNWSLKVKISAIAIGIILIFGLVIMLYIVPTMNRTIDDKVELELRELVEVAYSTIESYYEKAESGEMTEDEAKIAALAIIELFRYENGQNYYFILDYNANMVMHPIKPELNGVDLSGSTDDAGNYLFQEMADLVAMDHEGLVNYVWEKPGETEAQPKSSFVKGFEPWNVIVGTGIYVDDVKAMKATVTRNILIMTSLIALVTMVIVIVVVRSITTAVNKIMIVSQKISVNDYSESIEVNRNDELGKIAKSFNHAIDNVKGLVEEINSSVDIVNHNSIQLNVNSSKLEVKVENTSHEANTVMETISETAGSADNISHMIDEVKFAVETVATRATEGAITTSDVTERATTLKEDSVISSNRANKIYEEVKVVMEDAIEKSKAVEQINILSSAILDITSQTNLLALNASIEAARAGEAGRGFAVVADEISKLADQSSETVSKIQTVVEEVNKSVKALCSASERILEFIDEDVKPDYEKLVSVSEQYNKDATTFNGIMMDLSATAEELNASMDSIAEITTEMAQSLNLGSDSVMVITENVGDILGMTRELNVLNEENFNGVNELVETKSVIKL